MLTHRRSSRMSAWSDPNTPECPRTGSHMWAGDEQQLSKVFSALVAPVIQSLLFSHFSQAHSCGCPDAARGGQRHMLERALPCRLFLSREVCCCALLARFR